MGSGFRYSGFNAGTIANVDVVGIVFPNPRTE